ncbi:MAG: hypothetical protein MI784_07265 [Cytophagales bacterium]|nr:hypothetical protein [Cytophagales bacterium]
MTETEQTPETDPVQEYIQTHKAAETERCPVSGRWIRRIWRRENGAATMEEYRCQYPPSHRQSHAVQSVQVREVAP